MKKSTQIIATVLFLLVGNFAFSQNDSMYVVNGGVVIGKYAISKVDSVIFYNPDSKTSSDINDTEEASIVGEWLFTSIDVEVSTIVTKNGIVTEETDTNYTMDATDPDWEMSELEFTSDGFLLENGDTTSTYTHQEGLLLLTENEDDDYYAFYCSNDGEEYANMMGGILCPEDAGEVPTCPDGEPCVCIDVDGSCTDGDDDWGYEDNDRQDHGDQDVDDDNTIVCAVSSTNLSLIIEDT